MNKFVGQISTNPERRDGRWFFSIWNSKTNSGISCISSARYEAENNDTSFPFKPTDLVEVIGEIHMPGMWFFDGINKAAEQNDESTG